MKTSKTNDFIREELAKNIDAVAADVVNTLANKGIAITSQNVYQVRNSMKFKRVKPTRIIQAQIAVAQTRISKMRYGNTLKNHILNVLKENPEGLSIEDLKNHLQKAGYQNRSRSYSHVLENNLKTLVHEGVIAKQGVQYKLIPKINDNQLLREAVIDYAKENNIPNPESFPDLLIRFRREFITAKEKYSALFK